MLLKINNRIVNIENLADAWYDSNNHQLTLFFVGISTNDGTVFCDTQADWLWNKLVEFVKNTNMLKDETKIPDPECTCHLKNTEMSPGPLHDIDCPLHIPF